MKSMKSVGFMSRYHDCLKRTFMTVPPMFVEIFQPGPSSGMTNIQTLPPQRHVISLAKNSYDISRDGDFPIEAAITLI